MKTNDIRHSRPSRDLSTATIMKKEDTQCIMWIFGKNGIAASALAEPIAEEFGHS